MILFLDRLLDVVCTYYCVARVTCLVEIMFITIYTTQIIKGTHVRNGIAGLPYILHFMYVVCLIG